VEIGEQIFFEEIDFVFIPNQKSRDNASVTFLPLPVIAHVLCRRPRDGKMKRTLVPKAYARDPTGRRRAVPLAKENIVLAEPTAHQTGAHPTPPQASQGPQGNSMNLVRSSQVESAVAT
jgi:hypothetical protein